MSGPRPRPRTRSTTTMDNGPEPSQRPTRAPCPRATRRPPQHPQTSRTRPRRIMADSWHSGPWHTPQKAISCGLQPLVQGTHIPLVPGSSPSGPTIPSPGWRPALAPCGRCAATCPAGAPSPPEDGSGEVVRGSARSWRRGSRNRVMVALRFRPGPVTRTCSCQWTGFEATAWTRVDCAHSGRRRR